MMSTPTPNAIMMELSSMGSEQNKKVLAKHGAREPFFGVKVGDMKKIVKRIKKNHEISLELYATGNYDAMYLAGLIADETRISRADLNRWAKESYAGISEYTVPWVASESPHGWELALEWIESDKANMAAAGWSSLSNWVALRPDAELDQTKLGHLLDRVKQEVHSAPNRVRYAMNCYVIAAGSYVSALTSKAKEIAKAVGPITVEMGATSCTVPSAFDYILKIENMGRIGKKKKQARC
ncbi:MAG: DNA alkylation repair protein [Bacteroidota bacterium]|nr:DNA alkylation repair protein [Bacteroidota bacterium]MDP4232133.1 DNA alkylation repair protein [Bacteroidota bacterium]MDP4241159.1 DNA alkylation repair protein [Bacteroidota bacterium]MDP4286551.1 DNA alkylation repair protein [Bacteroidota bacterium]